MNIVGHQKQISFLDRCIKKGMVSHAYIFSGPAHVGKFSLALEIARKLMGSDASSDDPNLILVKPEISEKKGIIQEKDIRIEEIREARRKISLTSREGKYAVAIIDQADKLTKSAQNALLKTLEEPPVDSVIILVTSEKNKLFQTILSRCQIVRFNCLTNEEMGKIIPDDFKNKEEIIFWSMGRPGIAARLVKDETQLELRRETAHELELAFGGNTVKKFSLAEDLSKNVPLALEKMDWWLVILRKKMLDGDSYDPGKILDFIQKLSQGRETIKQTNANARLVLEKLFL